ncbi:MAG TPA: MotA/TolQ/ExbB proton channel family protein [Enhygromyxa sp.]|nr:MotA/TolQ/ExbB proton channel family protein [Enhygromyxa sp.]
MILRSLFDPLGVVVLLAVIAMIVGAALWFRQGQQAFDQLTGALQLLRRLAGQLHADHPIRRRLESAPVVDLSFEEITRLMTGDASEPAARELIRLGERVAWIERFAQFAVHLGILGTVFALVSSDPTDLESFRASLPMALGTTFWGLIGALALSAIAGACDSLIERARQYVRMALLEGLERPNASSEEH